MRLKRKIAGKETESESESESEKNRKEKEVSVEPKVAAEQRSRNRKYQIFEFLPNICLFSCSIMIRSSTFIFYWL